MPVITNLASDNLAYTEGDGAVVIDQTTVAAVSDVDSSNFDTGTLTVSFTAGSDSAEDVVAIRHQGTGAGQIGVSGSNVTYAGTTIGTFTGGSGGTDLVITLNTNADATATSALVQNITYENTDTANPTLGTRTVRYVLTDGDGGTSANYDTTVTFTAANDVPVITNLASDNLAYTEGDGAVVIDQTTVAAVSDVDSSNFDTGTLTVSFTAGSDSAEDVVAIRHQGTGAGQIGVSGSNVTYAGTTIGTFTGGSGGTDLVITLNTNADATATSALVQNITYENTDTANPTLGTRTVRYVLTDGDGGTSANYDTTVTFTAANDVPVITNLASDNLAYTEGDGAVVIDQTTVAAVSDVDSSNFDTGTLTVSFTAGSDSAEDVVAIRHQGTGAGQIGVSGSNVTYAGTTIGTFTGGSGGTDLVITLNTNADATATSALVQNITYENTDTANPTLGTRTVRYVLTDGDGGTSANYDTTVTFTAANDVPVITNLASDNLAYTEGDGAVVIDQTTVAAVSDVDSSNFDTGTLTVSFTAGSDSAEDVVAIRHQGTGAGQIGVSGSNVTYAGTTIGTFTGGSGGTDLVITLNTNADATATSALVQNITYENTDTANPTLGTRTVRYVLTDGDGGTSANYDTTVTFTAANDVPVATDDPGDFNADVVGLSPLSYWRLGEPGGSTAVDAGSSGNNGTYNGATLGQTGALTGDADTAVRFNGSTDYLEIAHDASYLLDNGSLQLWFNIDSLGSEQALFSKDSTGFDTGGHLTMRVLASGQLEVRLQSASTSFTVTSSSAVTAATWHHAAFTFGSGGMALYLDGQVVDTHSYTGGLGTTSGGSGNFEPIAIGADTGSSGNLVVTPLTQFFAGSIDEVAIFGSELSGGTIQDLYASGLGQYAVAEDGMLSVSVSEGVLSNDNDVDGDPLTAILVTDVTNGTLNLNSNGSFTYSPDPDFNGSESFTYKVNDGTVDGNTVTVSITVTAVPDNTVPGPQMVAEDTALAISGLSVNDVGGNLATVQLSVTQGTLNVTLSGTAAISAGSNGSNTLTLSGSEADINATLASVSYQGTLNYNGADTFTMLSTDANGNTDSDTVAITVTSVNDAPVATDDPGDFNADVVGLSPLSYWRLGEPSGSTAVDAGSSGNNGTYNGATLGQTGALTGDADTAVRFNGSTDYLEIAHDASYLLDNGSLQLWFNIDSLGSEQALFSKDSTGFDTGGHLTMRVLASGQLEVRLQSASTSFTVTSSSAVTAATWHHAAFTFGSGGMALYLDGQVVDTHSYTGGLGTTSGGSGNFEPIAIGADTGSSGNLVVTPLTQFFAGSIDEVAIFGSQLSADDIHDLYVASSQYYTLAEDSAIAVLASEGVLSNDSDGDGDSLTASVLTGPSNASSFTLNADGSFTYTPMANFNGVDTFTYQVSDGNGGTDTGTASITVTAQNDPPAITNLGGDTLAYTEGDGAVVIDQVTVAVVSDVDLSNFDTGTLTVSFQAGSDVAEDVLSIRNQGTGAGQIGVSGSTVTYAGTTIGTFTGGASGTDLVITLNTNADATATSALVQNITFENTDTVNPTLGARTVRYVLTDGDGGTSANYDTTVTVSGGNIAPVISSNGGGTTATVFVAENQLNVTTVTATDADIPVNTLSFAIAGGADQGLFTIDSGTGVLTHQSPPDFENPTDANGDGVYEVTVQVDDGNGGTDVQTLHVTVTDVAESQPPPNPNPNPNPNPTPKPKSTPTNDPDLTGTTGANIGPISGLTSSPGRIDDLDKKQVNVAQREFDLGYLETGRHELGFNDRGTQWLTLDDIVLPAGDPPFTQWEGTPVSDELLGRLDALGQELNSVYQDSTQRQDFLAKVATGTSLSLSAGFVAWLLRGGSLLSSLIAVLPAWRYFDPLPVLGVNKKERSKKEKEEKRATQLEEKEFKGLRELFESSSTPTKPTHRNEKTS